MAAGGGISPGAAVSGTPRTPATAGGSEESERKRQQPLSRRSSDNAAGTDSSMLELQQVPELNRHFQLLAVTGTGGFSTVYKAKCTSHPELRDKLVALKVVTSTTEPARIEREIYCLDLLRGGKHIANLRAIERLGAPHNQWVFVMDYVDHVPVQAMSPLQLQLYMKALLEALSFVHSKGIIHRDIKPNNFLYNPPNTYCLVDFGLASVIGSDHHKGDSKVRATASQALRDEIKLSEALRSGHRRSGFSASRVKAKLPNSLGTPGSVKDDKRDEQKVNRAGTRGYRSPEVLLRCHTHSPAIDVWSAGIIFLSILSARLPFFPPSEDVEALAELTAIFGGKPFVDLAEKIGKELLLDSKGNIPFGPEEAPARHGLRFVCERLRGKEHTIGMPDACYTLVEAMLVIDPVDRTTAAAALRHPYFAMDLSRT